MTLPAVLALVTGGAFVWLLGRLPPWAWSVLFVLALIVSAGNASPASLALVAVLAGAAVWAVRAAR